MRFAKSIDSESGRAAPFGRGPRPLFILACALAIALGPGGCGGASDQPTEISRAEFIAKVIAVCHRASSRIESKFVDYSKGKEGKEAVRAEKAGEMTADEAAARVAERILIPVKRLELKELRSLPVPDGDEGQASALTEAFDDGIGRAEAHPERAVKDGTEAFGKSQRLAGEYGIDGC